MNGKQLPARVLMLRFSALGDVAMTAPVVRAYAQAHPGTTFIMVSAPMLASLFTGIPNLQFEAIDTKEYKGIAGIIRLHRRLSRLSPHLLLDLHQVLRTYVLCLLFWLGGTSVCTIKKGRNQKRLLTRMRNKRLQPLRSMISRYEDVFIKAGCTPLQVAQAPLIKRTPAQDAPYRIGIAPFAKHASKEWSVDNTKRLIEQLVLGGKYHIFLFGGGAKERPILQEWAQFYPHTKSVAGSGGFTAELDLMGSMDLFVSMDSANMHFASFMGVPVVSIWGGTHPYAGFYGWRQDPDHAVQAGLPCRPCSVFGNKPCRFGTLACLEKISVDTVFQKIACNFAP